MSCELTYKRDIICKCVRLILRVINPIVCNINPLRKWWIESFLNIKVRPFLFSHERKVYNSQMLEEFGEHTFHFRGEDTKHVKSITDDLNQHWITGRYILKGIKQENKKE